MIHKGLQRYKRLPFGVSSASDQYQHEISTALAGNEVLDNISDGMCVWIWSIRMISASCTLQERQHFRPVVSRLLRHKNGMYNHRHGAGEYLRFIAISATPKALPTRQVEEGSAMDAELRNWREANKTGRFEKCRAYAPKAVELCVIGQLILRGTRIVLPNKRRQ